VVAATNQALHGHAFGYGGVNGEFAARGGEFFETYFIAGC